MGKKGVFTPAMAVAVKKARVARLIQSRAYRAGAVTTDRIANHAAIWRHPEDDQGSTDSLAVWWVCPVCRTTANPAINSVFMRREDGARLACFPCRTCKRIWRVTLEADAPA